MRRFILQTSLAILSLASVHPRHCLAQTAATQTAANHDQVLHPSDLDSLIPKAVFFRGQTAPIQLRNSGGVKFANGMYFFSMLVDTSGYSTGIQAKYQAYFVTEVPLLVGGKNLPPGAYGVGFLQDNKFVVMDIGAHDLFTVPDARDTVLQRPTPLQVIAQPQPGVYRLYEGRNYVTVEMAK